MTNETPAWHLRHFDGVEHGPYMFASIIDAAAQGNVADDTEVRHPVHTNGEWIKAKRIKKIAESCSSSVEAPPSEDATAFDSTPPPMPDVNADDFVKVAPKQRSNHRKKMIVPETFWKAFLALFDFRFQYYVTPWIIKIYWAGCVAFAVVLFAILFFSLLISPTVDAMSNAADSVPSSWQDNDRDSPAETPAWESEPERSPKWEFNWNPFRLIGVQFARILVAFGLLIWGAFVLLLIRLTLESMIVFFRIAEDLSEIRNQASELGATFSVS